MSKVIDFLFFHVFVVLGFWGLLAILVFAAAIGVLYKKHDDQTAFEMLCIGWLLALVSTTVAFVESYRTLGGIPDWWEIRILQLQSFVSNLVFPIVFTFFFVWHCTQDSTKFSLPQSRYFLFAVIITLLDVILFLTILAPMFGWHFVAPE